LSAKKKAPDAHPKPFDPNVTPIRAIVDVLLHDYSREIVLFIGTRFSNLYTSVHTPA
jgi:hypothetical protein